MDFRPFAPTLHSRADAVSSAPSAASQLTLRITTPLCPCIQDPNTSPGTGTFELFFFQPFSAPSASTCSQQRPGLSQRTPPSNRRYTPLTSNPPASLCPILSLRFALLQKNSQLAFTVMTPTPYPPHSFFIAFLQQFLFAEYCFFETPLRS